MPCWRRLFDLGSHVSARPLGSERVPKAHLFTESQHQIEKNEVQEDVLENMICGWIYDAKVGGLEMHKLAFRIIHIAKYKVSVFHEKL